MSQLDVIIPVLNEKENIEELVKRIDFSLTKAGIWYTIVFVDDFSTDSTKEEILRLSRHYPIMYLLKKGKIGKAYSIIEGAKLARAPILAMIDADLQYPPEALPRLYKIAKEKGIAVANRRIYYTSQLRRIASRFNRLIFGKILFGFECDTQSGLKVFRREIIENISEKDVSGWTIDVPLLLTARGMGFEIGNLDIEFFERKAGKSKINLIRSSIEIFSNAVKSYLFRREVFAFEGNSPLGAGYFYKGKKYITHNNLSPDKSAVVTFTTWQKVTIGLLISLIINGLTLNSFQTIFVLLTILTFLYFSDVLFSIFIIGKSLVKSPEINVSQREIDNLDEKTLPIYSILCPLYKEEKILPQFINSVKAIDWPKDRLDVILLLEEGDFDTLQKAKEIELPEYVRVVIVPQSLPKTKPKACNYGLSYSRGEYIVVYDAEDRPEEDQLKKAYIAFNKLSQQVVCVQSKLNYYNQDQNILTRLFTAEYSLWFDIVLPGLQSIESVIPLGGTSNHFKTAVLKKLQGWDPFNVTEDCDLGTRLFKEGYRTAIINSTTYEEANSNLKNWLRQRSRWIKGYMQTYLVHMRNPFEFYKKYGVQAFVFQLIIGLRMIFIMINPLLWLTTLSYFAFRSVVGPTLESLYPPFVYYPAVFSLIFGNFLYFFAYMIGSAKRGYWYLVKYVFAIPFYWMITSFSVMIALYQLIFRPYYWEKTEHGLFLGKRQKASPYPEISLTITPVFKLPRWVTDTPNYLKEQLVKLDSLFKTLTRNFIDLVELLYAFEIKNSVGEGKLRILIFNWRDTKHVKAGGAEVYIHNIAKNWVSQGHSVTQFSGWDGKAPRDETVDGVNIIRRGGYYSVYIFAPLYYLLYLRNKFDVIIDCENGIPFFTPLFSARQKLLLIHHVHQEVHRKHLKFPLSAIAIFLEGYLMPRVYRNIKVVTISPSSKVDIVNRLGLGKLDEVDIVSPGVELDEKYFTRKTPYPSFLYLGRLAPYKNIDVCILAFAKVAQILPDSVLNIVGEGEVLPKLKKLIRNLKLESRINLLGWVSEEDKIRYLSQSWVCLQPSSFEGWGITVLEANYCGTCVIASNVKGLRDSVIDGQTGYLVPLKDVDVFAAKMIELSRNPKVLNKLSQNAYYWARNYKWQDAANAFMNVIARELGKQRLIVPRKAFVLSKLYEKS